MIGVGNELRGDDGVGVEVARRVRDRAARLGIEVRQQPRDATDLLDAWQGIDAVVIVDTMRSGAAPGTIRRFDAGGASLPTALRGRSSTHALSLGEAIELGRALKRLPGRVIVYAIEGRAFDPGAGLSQELENLTATLADAVLDEASALANGSCVTAKPASRAISNDPSFSTPPAPSISDVAPGPR